MEARPTVHLPARDIPVPGSVSPQAQAFLARGPMGPPMTPPADNTTQAWRDQAARLDAETVALLSAVGVDFDAATVLGATIQTVEFGGATTYIATPKDADPADRRVYLYLHGGAWYLGGGKMARFIAALNSGVVGARTWGVDYRMPPDHPFPTSLEDCLAAYRGLLSDHAPEEIIVGGGSAGGNLAAALMLRVRDEGLPQPAALVLESPAVDLTASGDSWHVNDGIDPTLGGDVRPFVALYADGHDVTDPYISPLFGDLADAYPPTMLVTGTRDLVLSDTVRFHQALLKAGVTAELHVFEAQGHAGWVGQAPEDAERYGVIRDFAHRHWAKSAQ